MYLLKFHVSADQLTDKSHWGQNRFYLYVYDSKYKKKHSNVQPIILVIFIYYKLAHIRFLAQNLKTN